LAALSGLLPRLLLLLIRLLLSTTLLSALTWLLARLLGLLSALILITLGHSYLQLECELARDGQLPASVLCSFQRKTNNLRSFGPRPEIGRNPVELTIKRPASKRSRTFGPWQWCRLY
jgi:hypothetical protein